MMGGLIITTMFISIITTSLTSVSLEGRTNLRDVTVNINVKTQCLSPLFVFNFGSHYNGPRTKVSKGFTCGKGFIGYNFGVDASKS